MRFAAVLIGDQVRERHRLAEFLSAAAERHRDFRRPFTVDAANGGALPSLRRPSWARFQRWSAAHRAALLHERGGADLHTRGARRGLTPLRGSLVIAPPLSAAGRLPAHANSRFVSL